MSGFCTTRAVSHRCRKLSQHLFFRREKTVRWLEALYALLAKVDIVVLSTGILHGQTLKSEALRRRTVAR